VPINVRSLERNELYATYKREVDGREVMEKGNEKKRVE
jgi:hypothetical protein